MALNTGPSRRGSRNRNPGNRGGSNRGSSGGVSGGVVNPDFTRMMNFKASGGMNNPIAAQGKDAQYGPGAFGLSPSLYYQHFNQQGQPLPPPQQQNQQRGGMGGMMGGLMNSMGGGMFGMGGGQGMNNIVQGPSQSGIMGLMGRMGQSQRMGQGMGQPQMNQRQMPQMNDMPFNMSGGQFGGMRPGMNQGIGGGFWDKYTGY